ncbi:MAG: AlpA family phage regulatory protein [Hyphomonadaceae bacterium]
MSSSEKCSSASAGVQSKSTPSKDGYRSANSKRKGSSDRLIKLGRVKRITGLGKTTIYLLEKRKEFPRRVKIGSSTFWYEREVKAWIRKLLAERDRAALM